MSRNIPSRRSWRGWRPWLWRLLALGVLGGVFLAYTQPSLMQQLAEQLWACF